MMKTYDHTEIEVKWAKFWEDNQTFKVDISHAKKPFYNLAMFPYPSGEGLHVGHIIPYSGVDTLGRFMRMQGYDVFEPMGFDAFGIHSENFAIKQGIHPKTLIAKTTEYFREKQMKRLGTLFDWEREVNTTDPNYYKWTQWLFIQMFKHGLAEKRKALVIYCPSCKTVLSDEQTEIIKTSSVIARSEATKQSSIKKIATPLATLEARNDNNKIEDINVTVCERCKTPIEKRELEQWFFKITDYAEKLLNNLDRLDKNAWGKGKQIPEKDLKNGINWSEKTKRAQRNWIGKQEGIEIDFKIENGNKITVFTKFPETIFGVTYIALAPEHPFVTHFLSLRRPRLLAGDAAISSSSGKIATPASPDLNDKVKEIQSYVDHVKSKSEQERLAEGKEKTGVFTGMHAINQVNGEKVPIWIADYVLANYGTGAVMGVPAHDKRDFDFARKYHLPIKRVVVPFDEDRSFILKQSVPDNFVDTLQKNGFNKITFDTEKNIQVTFSTEQLGSFIKLTHENLSEKYFVDIVGTENLFIFKGEIKYFSDDVDELKIIAEIKKRWPDFAKERKFFPLMGFQWGDETAETSFYHNFLCFEEEGMLTSSAGFTGMSSRQDGKKQMIDWMVEKGIARRITMFKLRDWCISRQRYWGPPIPMIYCKNCADKKLSWFSKPPKSPKLPKLPMSLKSLGSLMIGWFPVPEQDLPVVLPFVENYQPTGDGKSPLANDQNWMKVKCPNCGGWAERETDVSDTFLDSAWYFLRYPSVDSHPSLVSSHESLDNSQLTKDQRPKTKGQPWDPQITKKWLPVDIYIGGHEHAVLHLMYARFITMALKDMGQIDFEEPFKRFFAHGLLIKEGFKMSKSRGNVVNPNSYLDKFGADTLRMYILFLGPYEGGGDFRDTAIAGMHRFLSRIWNLVTEEQNIEIKAEDLKKLDLIKNKTIKKVGSDIAGLQFNTAIASLMEYYNFLSEVVNSHQTSDNSQKTKNMAKPDLASQVKRQMTNDYRLTTNDWHEALRTLVLLLAPFAPFISEELWSEMGNKDSVHNQKWPDFDENVLSEEEAMIIVQINGKVKERVLISTQDSRVQEKVEKIVLSTQKIKDQLTGKKIVKMIFVSGKLINYVVI